MPRLVPAESSRVAATLPGITTPASPEAISAALLTRPKFMRSGRDHTGARARPLFELLSRQRRSFGGVHRTALRLPHDRRYGGVRPAGESEQRRAGGKRLRAADQRFLRVH